MSGAKPQVAATLHTRVQAECVDVLDQVLELQANEEEVLTSFVRCLAATLSTARSGRTPQRQTTSRSRSSSRSSDGSLSRSPTEHRLHSSATEAWITGVRDAEHLVIHLKIQETKHDSLVTHFQRLSDAFARSLLLTNTDPGTSDSKQARGSHFFEALAEKVRQLSGELADFTKLQWEAVESLGDQLKAAIAGSIPSPGNVTLTPTNESSVSGVVRFAQQLLDVVATKRKLIVTLTSVLGQIQVPPPQKLQKQQQHHRKESTPQRVEAVRENASYSARSATVSPDSVADSVADAVTSAEKAAARLLKEESSNGSASGTAPNDQETRRKAMQWLRQQHEYGSVSPATPSETPNSIKQPQSNDRAFRRETFGYGGLRGNPSVLQRSRSRSSVSAGSTEECDFVEVEDQSVYLSPSPQPPKYSNINSTGGSSTLDSRADVVSLADLETPPSIKRKSKTGSVAQDSETPLSEQHRRAYDDGAPLVLSPTSEALSEPSPQDDRSPQYYRGTAAPQAVAGSTISEGTHSRRSVSTRDRTSLSLSLSPPPPLARNLMCSEFNKMSASAENNNGEVSPQMHVAENNSLPTRTASEPQDHPYPVAARPRSPPNEATTSPPSPTPSSTRAKSAEHARSDFSPSLSPLSPSVSPDAYSDRAAVARAQQTGSFSSSRPKHIESEGNPHATETVASQPRANQPSSHDDPAVKQRDHSQWHPPSSARSAHSITSTAGETQNSPSSTMHNSSTVNSLRKPARHGAGIMDSNAESPKDRVAVQWRTQGTEGEASRGVTASPSQRIASDEQRFTNEQFHARLLAAEHAIEHHHSLVELLRADIRRLEAERSSLMMEQQEWKTLETELTTTVRKKDKQIEELRRTLSSSEARRNELELEVRQLKKRLLTTAATAAVAASTASVSPPSRASSTSPRNGGSTSTIQPQAQSPAPPTSVNHSEHPYSTGWSSPQPERERAYTWRSHLQEQRNRLLRQVEQRRRGVQQQQQQEEQAQQYQPQPPPQSRASPPTQEPRQPRIDSQSKSGAKSREVPTDLKSTTTPPPGSATMPNVERVLRNARALLQSINPNLLSSDSRSETSVSSARSANGNGSRGKRSDPQRDAYGENSTKHLNKRVLPTDSQLGVGEKVSSTFLVDDDDDERGSGRRATLERKLRGLGRTDPTEGAVSPCASLSYSASKQVGSEYNSKQRHDGNISRAHSSFQEEDGGTHIEDEDNYDEGDDGRVFFEQTRPPSRSTSSVRDDLMDDLRDQLDDLYREQASIAAQEAQINAKRESAVQQLQKQLQTMIASGKGNETAELVAQANTVMAKFSSVRRTVEGNRAAIDDKIRLVKRQIETLESDLL